MASWADRCESVWLDASLAAVLVTALTALAMIQCRQPARRRIWGRLGLVASFAIIPLAWYSPLPKLHLRHPTSVIWMTEARTERSHQGGLVNQAVSSTLEPGPTPVPSWWRKVSKGLPLIYACGLAVGLGRLGLGLVGSHLLVRQSKKASKRTEALLRELSLVGGKSRRPRLLVSDRSRRPVLVGFFHPTILIPPQLERPNAEAQIRLGLLHELAHAEVADHQFALLAAIMQSVWFFLPQSWWIRDQLRLDAEFLADHRAVGHFGTSYRYAESLVDLALDSSAINLVQGPTPRPAPFSERSTGVTRRAGGLASALFQRVQMLLRCPFVVEDQAPRSWAIAVAAIMVGWTLLVSSLSIQDGRDQPDEMARLPVAGAIRAFRLAELVIAPRLLDDRPFDLRFRLPDRFRLVCEVLAEPADLNDMEILGYRLRSAFIKPTPPPDSKRSAWRRVEIQREPGGFEAVHVDGTQIVATHSPVKPASWLTIRPIPGRTTRLRNLNLIW